jgi:hypothetical protein
VWKVKQRFIEFRKANEVFNVFGEVTYREIAGVAVVPLEREVNVVRLERL